MELHRYVPNCPFNAGKNGSTSQILLVPSFLDIFPKKGVNMCERWVAAPTSAGIAASLPRTIAGLVSITPELRLSTVSYKAALGLHPLVATRC